MKHTYDFSKYIAVTNRQLAGSDDSYFSQIEKIAALDPHAVILREKELNREEYAVFAARVKKICDKYGVTLFIHSHIDTARALCCKHLHLSFADFCCNTEKHENDNSDLYDIDNFLAHFIKISVSCHSIDEVRKAAKLGATQIVLGNIFETDCKKGLPGQGLDFLKAACLESSGLPVYAIGGISPANIGDVLNAGAAGGCMMSGFMNM